MGPTDFDAVETKALERLGLVQDGRLVPNYLERMGKGLYDALCSGDVGVAYQIAFGQARVARSDIMLQLRFDFDAVDLARIPGSCYMMVIVIRCLLAPWRWSDTSPTERLPQRFQSSHQPGSFSSNLDLGT